jgi:hypothetical protein
MRFTTRNEIDYLGALHGETMADARLVQELSRQLDALRRFDQYVTDADWRPSRRNGKSHRQTTLHWPAAISINPELKGAES